MIFDSLHIMLVAGSFVPKCVQTYHISTQIDLTSNQVLKMYLSLTVQKDKVVGIMKQSHTKHVYFSFFNSSKGKANSK